MDREQIVFERYIKPMDSLSAEDEKCFLDICTLERLPPNRLIECTPLNDQNYFYIIRQGMVCEYLIENTKEVVHAFYFENDFFGIWSNDTKYTSQQIVYKSVEPVMLYKIDLKQWTILKTQKPVFQNIWFELLESQINNSIHWQFVFKHLPAVELFSMLFKYKPGILKNMRLFTVIINLCKEEV
jgi:hypothetical protein